MTMRRGYTPSRPYQLRRTNQVYHDLRGSTIPATSPRTRTSFTTIGPVLASWAILRETLGRPRLTHLHHHPSHPRRQLPPVPHPTSRTRCSHLLNALMHSGTRPRTTESFSHRIWRRFELMCVRCWPTRPLFFSSSSPSRLSLLSSWHSITRHSHRHHRSDPAITRGVLFTLSCSFIASGDTGIFCLGGGGGGGLIGDRVFVRLVLFCFDFRISDVVYFYLCMLVYIPA